MSTEKVCKLYEGEAIRSVTGPGIRPGGFQLTERALDICALPAGARVLDVGCGTGATVEYLMTQYHYNAVGVDPSDILLAEGCQRNALLPLIKAVGEALPFRDGEMDCVFAECTLSVMNNLDQVLLECQRVLRREGYLVVSDLYVQNQEAVPALRDLPLVSCLTGAMSRDALLEKLNRAGFQVVFWEDHSDLLKSLVFQLIMTHGSMGQFWLQSGSEDFDLPTVQETIKRARPGYFLLVAQRLS